MSVRPVTIFKLGRIQTIFRSRIHTVKSPQQLLNTSCTPTPMPWHLNSLPQPKSLSLSDDHVTDHSKCGVGGCPATDHAGHGGYHGDVCQPALNEHEHLGKDTEDEVVEQMRSRSATFCTDLHQLPTSPHSCHAGCSCQSCRFPPRLLHVLLRPAVNRPTAAAASTSSPSAPEPSVPGLEAAG